MAKKMVDIFNIFKTPAICGSFFIFDKFVKIIFMKYTRLLIIALLISQISNAKYVQTCKVRYAQNYSLSKDYEILVSFFSGNELNQVTGSNKFSYSKTYAILHFSEDNTPIITLDQSICGGYSYDGCKFDDFHGFTYQSVLNGVGSDDRKWRICVSGTCY